MKRSTLVITVIAVGLGIAGLAIAGEYAASLEQFVKVLPADLDNGGALAFGPWALGAEEPKGSEAIYDHTDRAKALEATHEGAEVKVTSLDGTICGIRATWNIENADMQAAREAIFEKMGKTMEVNKNFSGDVSYNYRSGDKGVRLYLGTTSSKLVMSLEQVAPYQETFKLRNQK